MNHKCRVPHRSFVLVVSAALFWVLAGATGIALAQQPGGPPAAQQVGTLTFRLALNRMEPAQITVPEGRYWVRLMNGLVLAEIAVQLQDDRGRRHIDTKIPKNGSKIRALVDLTPGKYTLTAPARQVWTSQITVTKR